MREQLYSFATNTLSTILKTPRYIILFVSDKCHNRCRHCWYNEEWKSANLTKNTLSFDEIEKISLSIRHIDFLSLTGGEAFLRDDIVEISHLFASNSKLKRYDIPTSGFDPDLITSKTVEMLKINKGIPFRVNVSIDGSEETHDFIRNRNGSFKNAVKTIEALKKIRKKYSNFDVAIITTISKYNQNEIEELAFYVLELLPDGEWMINITREPTRDKEAIVTDLTAYNRVDEIISESIKDNGFSGDRGHRYGKWLSAKNSLRRDLIGEILDSKRIGGGCAAGCIAGVIFNDGEVRPCESLDESFGNIRDYNYSLPELWNSALARQIRTHIQKSRCICTHECFLSVSILLQPSCWFRLINKRLSINH